MLGSVLAAESRRLSLLRRSSAPWLFLLPAIVIMLVILGYPLIEVVILSMHQRELFVPAANHRYVGLTNYFILNSLMSLKELALNTLFWTLGSMVGQFMLGLCAALALNEDSQWAKLARTLLLTPWIISPVVAAVVWSWLYEPTYGIIDSLLRDPVAWLTDPHLAMPSLIVINIWLGYPFWMMMITAGLKTIPADLYEAAALDGANLLAQFWHITLPGIRAVLEATILLAFIFTTNSFALIQLLTGGGPGNSTTTMAYAVYDLAFVQQNFGVAAAASVLLTIVLSCLVVLFVHISQPKAATSL